MMIRPLMHQLSLTEELVGHCQDGGCDKVNYFDLSFFDCSLSNGQLLGVTAARFGHGLTYGHHAHG